MNYFKDFILLIAVFSCVVSCKKGGDNPYPLLPDSEQNGNVHNSEGSQLYADFESVLASLHPKKNEEDYTIADNPFSDKVNSSSKCGKITLTNDAWDFIYTAPMDGTFDFSKDTIVVSVKVYSEVSGRINFKFES